MFIFGSKHSDCNCFSLVVWWCLWWRNDSCDDVDDDNNDGYEEAFSEAAIRGNDAATPTITSYTSWPTTQNNTWMTMISSISFFLYLSFPIDFVQRVFVTRSNSLCQPVSRPFQNWTYIPNSANMLLMHKRLNLFPNSWFSTPKGKLKKDCIEAADKDNGLSESDSELLLPALMIKMMFVIIIRMVLMIKMMVVIMIWMVLMIMMIVLIWWLITN